MWGNVQMSFFFCVQLSNFSSTTYWRDWLFSIIYSCLLCHRLSSGHKIGRAQFSFQRKAMPKNVQTTTQLQSSHMLAKYCSKFSKQDFNSMWTVNFQMFKLDLEKAEEPEIKLPTSLDHRKKNKRIPEVYLLLLYWLRQSHWLCGSQQNVENSERDGNTRPPYLPPEKSVCRSRSNS